MINSIICHFQRFQTFAMNRMVPSSSMEKDGLSYWRVRVLFAIIFTGLLIGLFAFVPVTVFLIKEKMWGLLIFDGVAWLIGIGLLFARRPRYEIRASIALLTVYVVGLVIIISVGPLSGGPAWLFSFAVLSGVLLGSKTVIMALTVNAATLTTIGLLINAGLFGQKFPFFNTTEAMIVAGVNFMLLNTIAAVSVAILVKGLVLAHHKESDLTSTLERERSHLINTKKELELEVAERMQTEETLRESEEKYRELVENINDVIYSTDKNGIVTYISPLIEDVMGYRPSEIIGKSFADFIHPEDLSIIMKKFVEILSGNLGPTEYRLLAKSGEFRWIRSSSRPIYKEERVVGLRGLFVDVNKIKEMEHQLQQTQKMEAIGILSGGIAHDFNNLLTVIIGNISLTQGDIKLEIGTSENLKEAEKAAIRAKELATRLITFSKGGSPVKKPTPIGDLLKDSIHSSYSGFNIKCEFSLPADTWLVTIDKGQMKHVFHDIATNAGEAMGGKGRLKVYCENVDIAEQDTLPLDKGKYVKISIEDQGCGIPEKNIKKIFDPYFSTKEIGTEKGQGLGLAVSYSIIRKHSGAITVKSDLKVGSTFSIYLPASEKKIAEPETVTKPVPKRPVAGKGKILVMDDEAMIRKFAGQVMKRLGYDVEVCADGVEAIEMYKKGMESGEPFDAVILDLTNKLGMGGVDAIRQLLEIDPEVKGIVSTGYSNDPVLTDFKAYGFCGALEKPYTMVELSNVLFEVILREQ